MEKIKNDDEEYIKYFEKYFKLKTTYNEKLKKRIKSIKDDDKLSLNKKMKKIKNMKKHCIQCGRDGGTVFKETDRELHAYCNSKTDKCELDLHLKKSTTIFLPDEINIYIEQLNTIKEKIVKAKLDNIFELEKEDITTQKFNVLKEEYKEKNQYYSLFKNKLNEFLHYKWQGEEDEEKLEEIKVLIKENMKTFNELNSVFNKLIIKYKTEPKPNTILEEAIEFYKTKLLPLNETIRNLKYKFTGIEFEELNKFEKKLLLKKHKNTIDNYCIQFDAPEIINKDVSEKVLVEINKKKEKRKKGQKKDKGKSGATLTFSSSVENNQGMQIYGAMAESGFTVGELQESKSNIESKYEGAVVEVIDLVESLPEELREKASSASVLVFRGGVNKILEENSSIDLYDEHKILPKDNKFFHSRQYRINNKNARHNLCFAEEEQKHNLDKLNDLLGTKNEPAETRDETIKKMKENKIYFKENEFGKSPPHPDLVAKGTIYKFADLPLTNKIRETLPTLFGEKANNLLAEGNYYFDLEKTGIGFHGDSERKDVIGVRTGEDEESGFPLHYQWFQNRNPIGERVQIELKNGDIYVMSEKAVGRDWKRSKNGLLTLRHAAGGPKYLIIKRNNNAGSLDTEGLNKYEKPNDEDIYKSLIKEEKSIEKSKEKSIIKKMNDLKPLKEFLIL